MTQQPGVHWGDLRVQNRWPGTVALLLSSYLCDLEQLLNLSLPWAPAWEMGLLPRQMSQEQSLEEQVSVGSLLGSHIWRHHLH